MPAWCRIVPFLPNAINEFTQIRIPHLQRVQALDPVHPEINLAGLQPGPVVVHLWVRNSAGQANALPATLRFNYAPVGTELDAGLTHYFLLPATQATALALQWDGATENAQLFGWSPFNGWAADYRATGGAALTLAPLAEPGAYTVALVAKVPGRYTLTRQPGPGEVQSATVIYSEGPASKPIFLEPVVNLPSAVVYHAFLPQVQRNRR